MDTKLKNSRRAGIIIAVLTILGITAGIMASYPWIREQIYADAVRITESAAEQGLYEGYYTTIGGVIYNFQETWKTDTMIMGVTMGAFCLTALAALITGLIKPLGLTERKIFAAPFEVLAVVGTLAYGCLVNGIDLIPEIVQYSLRGEFQEELARELYMSSAQAEGLVTVINVAMWLFCVAFIYWLVVSLDSVFTLGLKRWFKERTLTGRILRWGKHTVEKTCTLIETVDFRDQPTKLIMKIVGVNFLLLTVISCFWFFGIFGLMVYSVVLFFLLRRIYDGMQEKYEILLKAAGKMAEGNLDVEIQEDLGVFEPLRGEINRIRNGFKLAVEEEVKSRSMKTELITNVSHDLKTPLTAIITYVNLLKKEDITPEERESYIGIIDQKSMRLKSLIEDLFEISKANSDNVTLNLVDVDVVSLMKQVRLELDDKIAGSGIDFRWKIPEEKILLRLDSEKTYRIFENLLVNIVKYALPGTRAYVEIEDRPDSVSISMKNISAVELSLDGTDITERFVRGDASRNTEGSGLGLAIAKSFTEIQGGKMEVSIDADLFTAALIWRKESGQSSESREGGSDGTPGDSAKGEEQQAGRQNGGSGAAAPEQRGTGEENESRGSYWERSARKRSGKGFFGRFRKR